MLTYISDVGDENLVNVFINLDGQDLTVRMQREVHREGVLANGKPQLAIILPNDLIDPQTRDILLSEEDNQTLTDIVRLIGRRMTGCHIAQGLYGIH